MRHGLRRQPHGLDCGCGQLARAKTHGRFGVRDFVGAHLFELLPVLAVDIIE
jgi:hypothetical protein